MVTMGLYNEADSALVNDLSSLTTFDEESILEQLQQRFTENRIYTYIGDILLSVNPFQDLPIYADKESQKYRKITSRAQELPHVYAVADIACQSRLQNLKSQCCVVSGESGAGKTECTKLLVKHVVDLYTETFTCINSVTKGVSNLHDVLIEINPLMEAFGNARTSYNDNSSRFGKYIELLFGEGSLCGGRVSIFLLEKSRVASFHTDETNLHIFYCLFAGLNHQQKKKYGLASPENHRVVRSSQGEPVFRNKAHLVHYKSMFMQLGKLLNDVRFSLEEVDAVYGYLAAIVHIADLDFEADCETDGVFIVDEGPLIAASGLLELPAEEFTSALISNTHHVRGEKIASLKNLTQAEDGRDSLAKTLYSQLFNWIIRKINNVIEPQQSNMALDDANIGILDVAGFENFTTNSFEQLCINVANEQLQFYFNQHVFEYEKRDLESRGVRADHINFKSNADLLKMFVEKPLGLFPILDEESRFPQSTALSFLDKLNHHLDSKYQYFRKEKTKSPSFTIQHFAGCVEYSVINMLEKNRDTLSMNILECLQGSSSLMLQDFFGGSGTLQSKKINKIDRHIGNHGNHQLKLDGMESLSRTLGKKLKRELKKAVNQNPEVYKQRTAGSQFLESLKSLTEKLMKCQPHFIRCIKPNNQRNPSSFDTSLVRKQLNYAGVLETVRIRRDGYPVRHSFVDFVARYKFIAYPLTKMTKADSVHCFMILQRSGLRQWEIGDDMVFLKHWHPVELRALLKQQVDQVIMVQKLVRGYIARSHMKQIRQEAAWQKNLVLLFMNDIKENSDGMLNELQICRQVDKEKQMREMGRVRDRERERLLAERRAKLALAEIKRKEKVAQLRLSQIEEERKKLEAVTPRHSPIETIHEEESHEDTTSTAVVGSTVSQYMYACSTKTVSTQTKTIKKGSWREKHLNQKEHVAGIRYLYEKMNELQDACRASPSAPPLPKVKTTEIFVPTQRPVADINHCYIAEKVYTAPNGRFSKAFSTQYSDEDMSGPALEATETTNGFKSYERGNLSHYARQTSKGSIQIAKADHYSRLIEETLAADIHAVDTKNWAKIIYMEKSFRCGNMIVSDSQVKIDGDVECRDSNNHFAINEIENPLRDDRTVKIRDHIGKGVRLFVDLEGGISAVRQSLNDVIVQDHNQPELTCISEEVIKLKGVLEKDVPVKVFDMAEFKSHIMLEIHKYGVDKIDLEALYRKCIISLTFVRGCVEDMMTPCWINVINLVALRMLQDDNVLEDLKRRMKQIKNANIDLAQISKLPSFVTPVYKEPNAQSREAVSPLKKMASIFSFAEKAYVSPKPVTSLDAGARATTSFDYTEFSKRDGRAWAKPRLDH